VAVEAVVQTPTVLPHLAVLAVVVLQPTHQVALHLVQLILAVVLVEVGQIAEQIPMVVLV
jgi:hypothetical protein